MMKKFILAVAAALMLGACLPLAPILNPAPTVDVAGTMDAGVMTSAAQTFAALPSPTIAPITETAAPSETSTPLPPESPTVTITLPPPNLTATPEPAIVGPITSTFTATIAAPASATQTATLGILTYGTLPPAVPFSKVTLFNKSKTQAYISLQVTTVQGGPTIIEYPVEGIVEIHAPTGYYLYVAWVGGRKMVGNFRLQANHDLLITLYRDKIVVR
jgi:hypothetical protein